jgi:hypothetical protein
MADILEKERRKDRPFNQTGPLINRERESLQNQQVLAFYMITKTGKCWKTLGRN